MCAKTRTIGSLNGGMAALRRIGLAVAMAYFGWVAHELYDHASRLATIEGNRFTSADAAKMWKDASAPPPWLIARLDRIEAMLAAHMERHADGRTE